MKFLLILLLPGLVFAETKFNNESEVSVIRTGGNSFLETYNGKTLSKWITEKRSYYLGGHYTLGSSKFIDETTGDKTNVESAKNWDVNAKYEQILAHKISGFIGAQVESDEFSGFKQRENLDAGARYTIANTDKTNSFAELGARYTVEKTVTPDDEGKDVFHYTKSRLYYEISHKKSETLSYKFWVEYLPNFTESNDYLITYEPSVAYVLSSTFSLKTAYKAVYDNQPNVEGYEKTDYTFTTSIIAKF